MIQIANSPIKTSLTIRFVTLDYLLSVYTDLSWFVLFWVQQGAVFWQRHRPILLETPALEGAKVGEGVQKDLFLLVFDLYCTYLHSSLYPVELKGPTKPSLSA